MCPGGPEKSIHAPSPAHLAGVDGLARRPLDGRDGQRLEAVDLVGQPPQRARRALRQQPVADRRLREVRAPPRRRRCCRAALADLGGAEHDVAGAAGGEHERVVGLDVRRSPSARRTRRRRRSPSACRARRPRGRGRTSGARTASARLSSSNVTSSMPTTTTSFGTARSPRISKRASTLESSARSSAPVASSSTTMPSANSATAASMRPAQAAGGRAAAHGLTLTDLGTVRARTS